MKSIKRRMKGYEQVSQNFLTKRMPVIIRVDGRAFHTFTKGMNRPEAIMQDAMERTAKYLCEHIAGCRLAYVQSDEISLLLTDYETLNSEVWFGYNVQKLVSVTASMATMAFEKAFTQAIHDCYPNPMEIEDEKQFEYCKMLLEKACNGEATFDARAFNIPQAEVCNYFIWRQQDATRNSIQMFAQTMFNQEELQNKKNDELQEMMFQKNGFNWNNCSISEKRGVCIIQVPQSVNEATKMRWWVDIRTPVFTQDREYIDRHVYKTEYEREVGRRYTLPCRKGDVVYGTLLNVNMYGYSGKVVTGIVDGFEIDDEGLKIVLVAKKDKKKHILIYGKECFLSHIEAQETLFEVIKRTAKVGA